MQATLKNFTILEGYTVNQMEEELKQASDEILTKINDISLKLAKFIDDQLCKFNPTKMKGQAIYVILFEYFKKYTANCADVISLLKELRKQELEEDTTMQTIIHILSMMIIKKMMHMIKKKNELSKNTANYKDQSTNENIERKKMEKTKNQRKKKLVLRIKNYAEKIINLFYIYIYIVVKKKIQIIIFYIDVKYNE
ncbi:hypothetical protein RFI_28981 [Reticulomyxa filosa]|uniref:Uncharacterized protein n=1 Tax=Reticulomyxa filosa TaxID=46433 RepID=X6M483_RETFI|nr:hypothetical protein RFI_28981 [Reticulomyxa filosa]|eukprot:ETO08406.1 hypothetical protein RFI_28981 [Reticulomyxa filosa]